ncbi:MAG: hypothetical protein EBZ77_12165 [Chitinophagia bacterium]|nr:hypothetical protein [Chitinophagia bacterium]
MEKPAAVAGPPSPEYVDIPGIPATVVIIWEWLKRGKKTSRSSIIFFINEELVGAILNGEIVAPIDWQ